MANRMLFSLQRYNNFMNIQNDLGVKLQRNRNIKGLSMHLALQALRNPSNPATKILEKRGIAKKLLKEVFELSDILLIFALEILSFVYDCREEI